MAKPYDTLIYRLRTMLDPARHDQSSDGELLGRWLAERDDRAFAALVWRHGAVVWRVARSLLPQVEDAEDVFQATFLVLAGKARSLKRRASLAGWLHQTAYRLALKTRTATVRRRRREDQVAQKTVADPLEEISAREAQAILAQELDRLPTVYREPLLLCVFNGATQDEAARQLGCGLRTLMRRLERGRALLGRRLTRRGLEPAGAMALTLSSVSGTPARLVLQTVKAAGQFVSGQAATGTAAVLAHGLLRAVLLQKLAVCVAVVCTLGGLTLVGGLVFARWGKRRNLLKQTTHRQKRPRPRNRLRFPRLDRFGDPLPPGSISRIGSTLFRHGGYMGQLLYTPDSKGIIGADSFLYHWDAATGKLRWRVALDQKLGGFSLAMSNDGKRLAVLTRLEFAVVQTETGKSLIRQSWQPQKGANILTGLAISADLATYALGHIDGTVHIHDAATGLEKLQIDAGNKAGGQSRYEMWFTPDSKKILITIYNKSGVRVYDTSNGKYVDTLNADDNLKGLRTVSHDCRLMATETSDDTTEDSDGFVLWNLATNKLAFRVRHDYLAGMRCAFSADDTLLAVGSQGKEIILYNTANGKEHLRLQVHGFTTSLAFSPDGKTLAAAFQGGFRIWEVATGKIVPPSPEHTSGFSGLRFTADGKQLRTFADGVFWWDVMSGKLVRHLPEQPEWHGEYGGRSISPDGKWLAEALEKGDVVLVDTNNGGTVRTLTGHTSMVSNSAFSPIWRQALHGGRI